MAEMTPSFFLRYFFYLFLCTEKNSFKPSSRIVIFLVNILPIVAPYAAPITDPNRIEVVKVPCTTVDRATVW